MDPQSTQQPAPAPQPAQSTDSSNAYVGFWRRFAALLIDAIVIDVISLLLTLVFHFGYSYGNTNTNASVGPSILIGVLYYVYFWSKQNGQTLGNKALHIRVVREDGKPIDLATAIIRYIGYIVSAIPLLLGFLWVIWDKKKQGWHDKMAGTIVVKA